VKDLRQLVADELSLAVDPRVRAIAAAIAAKHGAASRAVLFYGSCLRQQQLDGLMLDFYLIVSDYPSAYGKRWLAAANVLIPPNVFYFEYGGLAAKYAVLSEADFRREIGRNARSVSVWARFAQPSRLVWSSDQASAERAIEVVSEAPPTLFQFTLPMMTADRHGSVIEIWRRGFELTYASELRAERKGKGGSIIEADEDRYLRFGEAIMEQIATVTGVGQSDRMARWWRHMQRKGKVLSVLRLAKASLTFAGGADYIAWKINRHAGTKIELTPWQRRHPLLAGISLLPRLLRSGAVR
jgi:hypothetical protein